ncbi:MAG: hypothetical protein AMXMBFR47_44760 [Planctomycetota bacterium]
MATDFGSLWLVAIAGASLCGWWLAVRPGSSYRGVSGTVSCLIMLMAILATVLAFHGQTGPRRAMAHPTAHVP